MYVGGYYDFSKVTHITASAALVLAAEHDRTRHVTGRAPGAIRLEEWHPEVRTLLREVGFFDLLEIEHNDAETIQSERMILKFRSGAKVDTSQISGPDSVIEKLFSFIGENRTMEIKLCSAVIEAMNNVRDHAYPEKFFQGVRHVKNWWLTGAADRKTRRLTVSLYDQGITIPISLPNTWGLDELVRNFLERFSLRYDPTDRAHDGQAIETAMVAFQTSTKQAYRGLGLANIRKVVEGLPGGKLRIVSRYGEYLFRTGLQPEVRNHEVALEGTLIEIEATF